MRWKGYRQLNDFENVEPWIEWHREFGRQGRGSGSPQPEDRPSKENGAFQ